LSVKIHHGPPGAYKTSGAVADDFIPAVKSGRTVITNVRGLTSKKRIVEVLKKHTDLKDEAAKKFQIINLDTSLEANRDKMRSFFHWAPKGAFFLIDEINTIYPKQWRENNLQRYDFPGGVDGARKKKRPANITEAFEMHRHQNWDFSITTPSIIKVHEVVKSIAEVSYLHQNKATIGLKGSYWEIMHYADNTGRSDKDQLIHASKKIKKWVFDLYESTATGEVSDTIAGRNVFLQPKVLAVALFIVAFFIYTAKTIYGFGEKYHPKENQNVVNGTESDAEHKTNTATVRQTNSHQGVNGGNSGNGAEDHNPIPNRKMKFVERVLAGEIYYLGSIGDRQLIETDGAVVDVSALKKKGVTFKKMADCFYSLRYKNEQIIIICKTHEYDNDEGIVDTINPF